RLRFGPDGRLFVGTGDAGNTSLPPDADSTNGKILAINVENQRSSIVSTGHRNPQGLCFTADGRFLSTEHGPDRGDEVNLIEQGKDYGWPDSSGDGIKNYTPTIAPGGCAVYDHDAIPQWKGSLLFTTLKEKDLRRLTFAADGSVADEEILYDGEFGRLRDVAVGPDGAVYLATSNKDTRGNPKSGDDRIVRVAPAN
ncbi:MAG TPA: PQQ-dependent sugar dehydrogenase, partial [Acidimicrobiales bacterium]|nr:PQQ-dependent sugar dehydrogenase [Acidimicrobiales bacterium]